MEYSKTIATIKEHPQIVSDRLGVIMGSWDRTNYGYGKFTPNSPIWGECTTTVLRKITKENGQEFYAATAPYNNEAKQDFDSVDEFIESRCGQELVNNF